VARDAHEFSFGLSRTSIQDPVTPAVLERPLHRLIASARELHAAQAISSQDIDSTPLQELLLEFAKVVCTDLPKKAA